MSKFIGFYTACAAALPSPFGRAALRALNGGSRVLANPRVRRTRDNFLVQCDLYDFIPRYIFLFGHWEPNVSAVIREVLQPGDVFVDVGANIGYDSLLAGTCVGSAGAVVAIEAVPDTFARLEHNIRLNSVKNIRAVQRAASDRPGVLTLHQVSEANTGRATTRPQGAVLAEVEAAPLDAILSADERARVRLIKIDIEGGELPVLNRLLDTLTMYPQTLEVVVELSEHESNEAAGVFARFLALGFEAFAIENEYSYEWYSRWRRPAFPRRIERLPPQQTDIWFRRARRN